MQKPIATSIVNLATKSIDDLQAMDIKTLITTLRAETKRASSAHVNGGKIIFAVDGKRESDKSLTAWLTSELGEKPHDHALMCAVSFRMVDTGHGSCSEEQWDTTPLKWHLQVSPILKHMEKEKTPAETVSEIREQMAEILREKPSDGEKRLKAIKAELRGEPENKKKKDEPKEPIEPEEKAGAVDYLDDSIFEAIAHSIDTCTDSEKLTYAMKSLFALAKVSQAKIDTMTTPVTTPELVAA